MPKVSGPKILSRRQIAAGSCLAWQTRSPKKARTLACTVPHHASRGCSEVTVFPDGPIQRRTQCGVEWMSPVSLAREVRGQVSSSHHPVAYRDGHLQASGASPLSLPTFFAAAKKVGAAPHRGEANRPITKQGEANAVGNHQRPAPTNQKQNLASFPSSKRLHQLSRQLKLNLLLTPIHSRDINRPSARSASISLDHLFRSRSTAVIPTVCTPANHSAFTSEPSATR